MKPASLKMGVISRRISTLSGCKKGAAQYKPIEERSFALDGTNDEPIHDAEENDVESPPQTPRSFARAVERASNAAADLSLDSPEPELHWPQQQQTHKHQRQHQPQQQQQPQYQQQTQQPQESGQPPRPAANTGPITAEAFARFVAEVESHSGITVLGVLREICHILRTTQLEDLEIRPSVINKLALSLCGVMRSLHPVVGCLAAKTLLLLLLQTTISLDKTELVSKTLQNMAMTDLSKHPEFQSEAVKLLCVFACGVDRGEQCVRECISIMHNMSQMPELPGNCKRTILLALASLMSSDRRKVNVGSYHEDVIKKLGVVLDRGQGDMLHTLCALAGACAVEVARNGGGEGDTGRCEYYLAKCALWTDTTDWAEGPEDLVSALKQYLVESTHLAPAVKLPRATMQLTSLGAVARHYFWKDVLDPDHFIFIMNMQTHVFNNCYITDKSSNGNNQSSSVKDTQSRPRSRSFLERFARRHSTGVKQHKK